MGLLNLSRAILVSRNISCFSTIQNSNAHIPWYDHTIFSDLCSILPGNLASVESLHVTELYCFVSNIILGITFEFYPYYLHIMQSSMGNSICRYGITYHTTVWYSIKRYSKCERIRVILHFGLSTKVEMNFRSRFLFLKLMNKNKENWNIKLFSSHKFWVW